VRRSSKKPARRPRAKALRGKAPRSGATRAPAARARTRLDVDERRAQLVELGLAEFGSRTYDEVSIDLIAQQAGISKGLLYHYFPTKRAFYLACVREAAGRLLARMDAVPNEGPPLEILAAGLDAYLEHVRAHGRAFVMLMRGGDGVDREIASVVDETRANLLGQLTSGLAALFPASSPVLDSPLLQIALTGWIGLAEAASIAWVDACVAQSRAVPAPAQAEVRDLLANALVAIVQATRLASS
jgi:AcrR family transcriptional regulator